MSRLGRSLRAPMPLPWLLPLPLPLTWLLPLPLPRTLPLPEVVITSLPPPLPAEVRTAVALDACVTTTAFVAREAQSLVQHARFDSYAHGRTHRALAGVCSADSAHGTIRRQTR